MGDMKSLILMLLLAMSVQAQSVSISVQAQSLSEVARQERERKAGIKPAHVLTTESAKTLPADQNQAAVTTADIKFGQPAPATVATPEGKPAETKPGQAKPAEPPKAVPAPTPTAPLAPPGLSKAAEEALKRYMEQLAKMRARVVELQDQETALQLQINNFKNDFLSPVTDPSARAQAQANLQQAQIDLGNTQRELADERRTLQLLEAQGPPKP